MADWARESGEPGISEGPSFAVYPNPAGSFVNVDLRAAEGRPVTLLLTELTGRPVSSMSIDKAGAKPIQFPTRQLTGGTYLLVISPDNQPRVIRRVIKLDD